MGPAEHSALADAAGVLACPECIRAHQDAAPLGLEPRDRALRCGRGHSFDVAKQGYVSLLTGASTKMTGDTAAMLDARAAFQSGGHFAPIADAVTHAVTTRRTNGPVLEIGAGTGYYLARALDAAPPAVGIGLDVAKPAVRRCARAHPRAAAVLADAWRGLPIRDGALACVLSVFAPRNPGEIARVLAEDGRFVVATPTERHLRELIEPLDMVRVDPDKDRRLDAAMAGHFEPVDRTLVEYPMTLARADVAHVVGMGPSAHHAAVAAADPARLPESVEVTASVVVGTYRPAA
ncbi:putative RNA methyltransferase [Nocardia gamkensis]|uniref:Methyltransferase type 11 n=1 Tax=Nocardia gamkensis TaxID=352869 RepID=A0A7X6L031_9NOCA|nr:methyltransferase domain-containing protein [Nocardia gamkensis]NKY25280.1 methyltransferase type 11 [Nocardia gamkensis]NQE69432.1 23S rRNA (guanine(748)-N(1))-methyltransferase [Nocardia gamkensis]